MDTKNTYKNRFVTILVLGDKEPNNYWEMNDWKISLGKQSTGFIPKRD